MGSGLDKSQQYINNKKKPDVNSAISLWIDENWFSIINLGLKPRRKLSRNFSLRDKPKFEGVHLPYVYSLTFQ